MLMNKLLDLKNHTKLSISGMEQNVTCHFQKESIATAIYYNNHAE